MGGEASVWNPQTVLNLSADTKRVEQRFTATAGQTLFTLTTFTYAVGTGSLAVYQKDVNDTSDSGAGLLAEGVNWSENTTSTFSLVKPAEAGDTIIAVGYVAITANVDVRETDIYVTNYQALRDYAGSETVLWASGQTTAGDGGEHMFSYKSGEATGYYVDDNYQTIVPTGGDGSAAWVCRKQDKRFATHASAVASKNLIVGDTIIATDRLHSRWKVVLTSSVTPNGRDIVQSTGNVLYSLQLLLDGDYVNAAVLGAAYDDSTDDKLAIQAAVELMGNIESGGVVYVTGPSRVSVTKGTNDKYGINIPYSNVVLKFGPRGSLRRLSSNISTYALSFPVLLIGVPDSNDVNDKVSNIRVEGKGKFIGENTRHAISAAAIMDGRQAIQIKNAEEVDIDGVKFSSIDSSAIYVQRPGEYDYENSQYYNTTKCYNITVNKCRFIGTSHSTAGRALLHAVVATADEVTVTKNYSKWCDVFMACGTTYDDYNDLETDTYTDANLGLAVKRVGKGFTVDGNTIVNSSEHGLYLDGMGISATGNNFIVTDSTTCNDYQFKIRGRGVSVVGGTMTGVHRGFSISTGAMDVTCKGTVINAVGDHAGGIVNINSDGLTAFINARSSYFGSYKPMTNIRIDVTINMPTTAQTHGVGVRLLTDTSDANFPNGQMINVDFAGTTINNAKKAVLNIAPMARNVQCDNMIFNGKTFTETNFGATGAHDGAANAAVLTDSSESWTVNAFVGWTLKNKTDGSQTTVTANTATTITGVLAGGSENDWDIGDVWQLVPPLNSLCVLAVDDSLTDPLQNVSFSNNKIKGFQYVLYDDGGAGGAGTIYPPYGIQGNEFRFVEFWDTAAFIQPSIESRMRNNTGLRFLDRTGWFSGYSLENSMSDGSSNSEKKGCMFFVSSTDVRFYYDDSGNYKAL